MQLQKNHQLQRHIFNNLNLFIIFLEKSNWYII